MLQQLVSESSGPRTVYTEDVEGPGTEEEQLHGVAACQANDVLHKNWLVELVNSQVCRRQSPNKRVALKIASAI